MILLASLLGFLSSMIPSIIKFFQDKADKRHELKVLELQLKADASKSQTRLDAILANVDLEATKVRYRTYKTGITWIDAVHGLIRPLFALGLFALYVWTQYQNGFPWAEEDHAIFAGVISFYFGARYAYKLSNGSGNGSNGNGHSR